VKWGVGPRQPSGSLEQSVLATSLESPCFTDPVRFLRSGLPPDQVQLGHPLECKPRRTECAQMARIEEIADIKPMAGYGIGLCDQHHRPLAAVAAG
jgi:hypothetical protein